MHRDDAMLMGATQPHTVNVKKDKLPLIILCSLLSSFYKYLSEFGNRECSFFFLSSSISHKSYLYFLFSPRLALSLYCCTLHSSRLLWAMSYELYCDYEPWLSSSRLYFLVFSLFFLCKFSIGYSLSKFLICMTLFQNLIAFSFIGSDSNIKTDKFEV
jgi:hypothetical protein